MNPDTENGVSTKRPVPQGKVALDRRLPARRLRVLTWHVHGNYLYYLSQVGHDFYIVTSTGPNTSRPGRVGSLPWGENVIEVPDTSVRMQEFDCILYQSRRDYCEDRLRLLSPAQRRLPQIYLEHDPPQIHPTNTCHWVEDRNVLLVHVTAFNALMWDSGAVPSRVIEHGVLVPEGVRYSGELRQGIVVVNNLQHRGRRLGADLFHRARQQVDLELVGIGAQAAGGRGEIGNTELAAFMARYRFFFNPIRYTSLGLAVVEAMMIGMPVVGLATTELSSVVRSGVNGYVDTRLERLVEVMQSLQGDIGQAREWGCAARLMAQQRFGIGRFVADWNETLLLVTE